MTAEPGTGRRRLVLVRHAKSSWDDPTLADHDRPLAERGLKARRRMREHLDELGLRPDLVLCSSSRRTLETLDGIRPALGKRAHVEIEPGIYEAAADDLLARLAAVDDEMQCVVVIAHNPGLEDLVDRLVAWDDPTAPAFDAFPTGAITVLSFAGRWRDLHPGSASLESFWRPRPPR